WWRFSLRESGLRLRAGAQDLRTRRAQERPALHDFLDALLPHALPLAVLIRRQDRLYLRVGLLVNCAELFRLLRAGQQFVVLDGINLRRFRLKKRRELLFLVGRQAKLLGQPVDFHGRAPLGLRRTRTAENHEGEGKRNYGRK